MPNILNRTRKDLAHEIRLQVSDTGTIWGLGKELWGVLCLTFVRIRFFEPDCRLW